MEIKIKHNNELVDASIEMVDGVMVVSPKEAKIDITQFKDGDIITCGWENEFNSCSWVSILNGSIEEAKDNYFIEERFGIYLAGGSDQEDSWINSYSDSATWVRHATDEEKKLLLDKLKEKGFEWDSEKKELVGIKWKPKEGEVYYYPWFNTHPYIFMPCKSTWYETNSEITALKIGWVFRTKEECEAFCERLNEAIKEVKP